MTEISSYSRIFFVGIGGIGMSALARYFLAGGYEVAGYDRTPSSITGSLEKEGAEVFFADDPAKIPEKFRDVRRRGDTLVIYTPAVPRDHPVFRHFSENGYEMFKRAEVLGMISDRMRTVAVAGTHGKTTTSTMIAHILKQSVLDCTAFLGGISKNYNTNLLLGESSWVVLEADEYDRSFLHLHPSLAVVTSMDADHLDIYGDHEHLKDSFHQFMSQVRKGGKIILHNSLGVNRPVNDRVDWFTYGLEGEADYRATDLHFSEGYHIFSAYTPEGIIEEIRLGLPGRVNVENALAAIAVSHLLGVSNDSIRKSLLLFEGVRRRFDVRVRGERYVYIDDYAHHPSELRAAISSAREMFPGKKITGIFQPHLYTRTRDFADGFAESLEMLDRIILLPIYPAREEPIPGITSEMILQKIKKSEKELLSKEAVTEHLRREPPEILMTLGAGDIDRLVKPIEKIYKERNEEESEK
jgi:UDP-N-acetylmuramate--alanine ligase